MSSHRIRVRILVGLYLGGRSAMPETRKLLPFALFAVLSSFVRCFIQVIDYLNIV